MEVLIIVETTDKGFMAFSDEFQAVASGKTEEEALGNIREAILKMMAEYGPQVRKMLARRRVRKIDIAA